MSSTVVKLFPNEEIEPDHEPSDAWRDIGYGGRELLPADGGSRSRESPKSEFDLEFERNFGPWDDTPIPPRPPGWKPPVDDDEDLPF